MTIDREKLIQLLVGKTGFERERVEAQLSELINRIQEAAREGKSFEIERFGTFSIKDDELIFEPADELETEVNHKYAGMEPIELIGAYDEGEGTAEDKPEDAESEPAPDMVAETEDEPEESESGEDIFGLDDSSPLSDQISKARTENAEEQPEPIEDQEEVEEPETTEEEIDEVLESLEEEPVFEEPEEEPEEELAEADDAIEEDEDVAVAEPDEAKAARWEPGSELRTPSKQERKKKKKDPIGSILVVFLILIVAGVGGWFAYDMGYFSGLISTFTGDEIAATAQQPTVPGPQQTLPTQQESQTTTQQQQAPGNTEENNQQQTDQPPEPEAENEVATSEEDAETGQPLFGLKGEVNPVANTGYTIVVFSLQDESNARDIYNELSQEGYRTVLAEARVNGEVYWRVGVGQFETVSDAQNAAGSLREPYRNNFFIKRIR